MTQPPSLDPGSSYEAQFGCEAAILIDPDAGEAVAPDFPRRKEVDALTILRWISRPAASAPRLLMLAGDGATAELLHEGAEAASGNVLLAALPGDLDASNQLRGLGLPAEAVLPAENGRALVPQQALAQLLRFAVMPAEEAPATASERLPPPDPESLPLDIYASSFIGLATEFGASLEAIWHIMWELSGVRWCLLNGDAQSEDPFRIPYRTELDGDGFIAALRACNEQGLSFLSLPLYVGLGAGRGHAIHVESFDGDEVVFHDPWPGRSLLAPGNNDHGLEARPTSSPRIWRIGVDRLREVAYASLVSPAVWRSLCGETTTIRYDELTGSDFFSFFHLAEVGRSEPASDGSTVIELQPGAWKQQIALTLTAEADERVRDATLTLDRDWVSAPDTSPLAFDLLKSFVASFVTPSDLGEAGQLVEAIAGIPTNSVFATLSAGSPHLLEQLRSVVLAVVEESAFGRVCLPCSTIRAVNSGNSEEAEGKKLHVTIARSEGQLGPAFEDRQLGYEWDDYRESVWQKAVRDGRRLGWIPPADEEGA